MKTGNPPLTSWTLAAAILLLALTPGCHSGKELDTRYAAPPPEPGARADPPNPGKARTLPGAAKVD